MLPETTQFAPIRPPRRGAWAQQDHWLVRWTLILAALAIVGILVVIPLINVFYQAFAQGLPAYLDYLFGDPDTRHAILLTLIVAPRVCAGQHGIRDRCCLGHRPISFPGTHHPDDLDRPALLGLAGCGWAALRADFRLARLSRALAGQARHPDHPRCAGIDPGNCIRDVPIRGPRVDSRNGGHRPGGRTGSSEPGRQCLASLLARDAA